MDHFNTGDSDFGIWFKSIVSKVKMMSSNKKEAHSDYILLTSLTKLVDEQVNLNLQLSDLNETQTIRYVTFLKRNQNFMIELNEAEGENRHETEGAIIQKVEDQLSKLETTLKTQLEVSRKQTEIEQK